MLLGARATFVDFSRFWGWHPFQLLFSDDARLKLWDRLRRLLARNKPENTGPASSIGRGAPFHFFLPYHLVLERVSLVFKLSPFPRHPGHERPDTLRPAQTLVSSSLFHLDGKAKRPRQWRKH
jgi:hypothetical protein